MNLLNHISILKKFIGVIALMGVLFSGGIWYATSQMAVIDDAYSLFIVREAKGVAQVRSLHRYIFELNYAVYRTIAETDADEMRRADARFEKAVPMLDQGIRELREEAPSFSARIDDTHNKVKKFIADVKEVRTLASSNRNDQALVLGHTLIDPQFDSLVNDTSKLSDDIAKYMENGSDDLTNQTNVARRIMIMFGAVSLLIGSATAAIVTIFGVTRPMNALRSAMSKLAARDTTIEVPGLARKDELGPMADAVQVF